MLTRPKARLDNVKQTIESKLSQVFRWADSQTEDVVVICSGDITDTPRSWYTASWLIEFLKKWWDGSNPLMYVVYGQHDLHMHSEESKRATSLGLLKAAGLVEVLGSRPISLRKNPVLHLYGCDYGHQTVPEPLVPRGRKHLSILAIHRMVLSEKLWASQEDYEWAPKFLRKHKEYDFILCGDYHYKFLYHTHDGRTILNTGCMLRKTAARRDIAHRPGFFIHNTNWERGRVRWMPLIHKPAEQVLTRKHLEEDIEEERLMEEFAVDVGKAVDTLKDSEQYDFKKDVVKVMVKQGTPSGVKGFALKALEAWKR